MKNTSKALIVYSSTAVAVAGLLVIDFPLTVLVIAGGSVLTSLFLLKSFKELIVTA